MGTLEKFAIIVLVVVATAVAFFFYGRHFENEFLTAQHTAALKGIDAENSKALADAVTKARKEEQGKAIAAADIDKSLMEKQQNEIISKNRAIDDLRTGAVQLRKRFTCDASASGTAGAAGTSTGSSDAGTPGGLSAEDAGFFISEASRADQVVLQLQACQALIKSDRGQ